jgi:hypothetical protein
MPAARMAFITASLQALCCGLRKVRVSFSSSSL